MHDQEATLFENAAFVTLDPAHPQAEALLVHDGRISAVGSRADVADHAPSGVRTVDLGGWTALPGFIDAHCHVLSYGLTLDQVDVSPDTVQTIDDLKRTLGQRVSETENGEWVLGRGYNQNALQERRHPTRTDLDQVSEAHPIVLWHASGHALTCNSAALRVAGIDRNTSTPAGGDIEHDEHGELTGVLKEYPAMGLLTESIAPPSRERGTDAVTRAMHAMAAQGITTACDAATTAQDLVLYRDALASGDLHGRITLMPIIQDVAPLGSDETHGTAEFDVGDDPEWLTIGPTKIFSDGALTTRTAAVRQPFVGEEGLGLLIWEPDQLLDMMTRAHHAGWQIATHAIGDRAVETVLDCYERVLEREPRLDHRHRIEHCMMVDQVLALRIQRLGVVPVLQPGFVARLGDGYVEVLGLARSEHLMPVGLFHDLSIPLAFSSDRPVIPGAPLTGILSAMQRRTPSGTVLGEEHCIAAVDAIELYTQGSAFAMHQESDRGALRAGMLADFVVLSHEPLSMPAERFADIQVEMTVTGGSVVYGR